MKTDVRKKKQEKEESGAYFSQGITIAYGVKEPEEDRRATLLLKGLLIYLIVMGALGCFLSSVDIEYSALALHAAVLISALYCAMLYYDKRWERIGYLLLLALIICGALTFRTYINSGFYAIINDISEKSAVYFDTSARRSYGEQASSRYAAVTLSMCYIGCVCCILVNILVSRGMRYGLPALMGLAALFVPLYLELEPALIYAAMFMAGLISVYIMKTNGHYRLTEDDRVYEVKYKEKKISYLYAARSGFALTAAVFIFCVCISLLFSLIYPKEQFNINHSVSNWKQRTLDTAQNISTLGIMGLFNYYPSNGGLTSGTLGGVSSVRLDLETDLTIEFTPYSDSRVYLKNFVGGTYLPYSNRWSRMSDGTGRIVMQRDETAAQLKLYYELGGKYAARGVMKVTNVAAPAGVYLPYYSQDTDKLVYQGRTQEYVYYPQFDSNVLNWYKDSGQMEQWLYVPAENLEAVAAFVNEAGLSAGGVQETVDKLALYYQENIPYTLRPGMTPRKEDFINYFLEENRRGYCAHFASAATLIFRYLGIPARYVEGYAIDASDIAGRGAVLGGEKYEDYYDGYSLLDSDAVVSVDATDANAHAWVEVYDSSLGWIVADVTPASYEEEAGESLWQRLINFLSGGQNSASEDEENAREEKNAAVNTRPREISIAALGILAVLALAFFIGRPLAKKISFLYKYVRSDINGRLIIDYQTYIRRFQRRSNELTKMVNYSEQFSWLRANGFLNMDDDEAAECVRILEKAAFSKEGGSAAEASWLKRRLKRKF